MLDAANAQRRRWDLDWRRDGASRLWDYGQEDGSLCKMLLNYEPGWWMPMKGCFFLSQMNDCVACRYRPAEKRMPCGTKATFELEVRIGFLCSPALHEVAFFGL